MKNATRISKATKNSKQKTQAKREREAAPATVPGAPPISADGLAGMPSRADADDVAPVTAAPVTPTMPSPRPLDTRVVLKRYHSTIPYFVRIVEEAQHVGTWSNSIEHAHVWKSERAAIEFFLAFAEDWFNKIKLEVEFVPAPAWTRRETIVPPTAHGEAPACPSCGMACTWREGAARGSGWYCLRKRICGRMECVPVPVAALPAWVREGVLVRGIGTSTKGREGVLREEPGCWQIDGAGWQIGKLDGIEQEWAPVRTAAPQPPPGFARDLAERQAFGYSTARERIASVLTRAGAREGTATEPGLLVNVTSDGRVVLRWGMKREGVATSCSWTDAAEQALERASSALHGAGYKATVGGPSASAITGAVVERAGVVTEAGEEAARLEERLARATARNEDLERLVVSLSLRLAAEERRAS